MAMIGLVFFSFLISAAIHEFGHGYVMRKKGIPLKEAGLGFSIKGLPSYKKKIFGLPITLNLLLLGAYVEPTRNGEKRISKLSIRNQAHIDGAGVLGNIIFGLILLLIAVLFFSSSKMLLLKTLCIIIPAVALWYWQEVFCLYILPILGVLMAWLLAFNFATGTESLVGPIGIAASAKSYGISNLKEVFIFAASCSLGIGLFNALPIPPLDGGRIAKLIVKQSSFKKAWPVYSLMGTLFLIGLTIWVLLKDIYHLFR